METLLFYYCLILTILISAGSAYSATQTASILPLILFLPVTVYFLSLTLGKIRGHRFAFPFQSQLRTFSLYYGFIVVTIMTISGLIGAKNIPQLISGVIFLPLALYFIIRVLPKKRVAIILPTTIIEPRQLQEQQSIELPKRDKLSPAGIDVDRRQFLKLISSAGLSLFLFSIFAKKAEAAFFGSVPGPGTVALKDTSGTQIDPAISTPIDGYKITEIEDSTPAFFGFVRKDGAWFIMKESSGAYRYVKGTSSFSTNWTNRASLTYDYFDTVF